MVAGWVQIRGHLASCVSSYYYYYYTLWWRCRTTAAGPPYNVSVTFRRLKNSHNIYPQLFSGNTRHVRESIHSETLPKQRSFQFLTVVVLRPACQVCSMSVLL